MSTVLHQSSPHQGLLEHHLHCLFPRSTILNNAKKAISIKNPRTGSFLEVDVWVPEAGLCFEFQDEYHYKPSWYSQIPLLAQQRDDAKRSSMLERSQTLIVVPYWWDGTYKSLKGTIRFHRPDLLSLSKNAEIPSNPPNPLYFDCQPLMLASYPGNTSILELMELDAWWIGEKWDGIRCYWNSTQTQLYTRYHVEIELHPNVKRSLGCTVLDGEIWCGRSSFHESQYFLTSAEWSSPFLRLLCFDDASLRTQHHPFEIRYATLLSALSSHHPSVIVAWRLLSHTPELLLNAMNQVTTASGEGLVLQRPMSPYRHGRSLDLFKIKASHNDQEALVLKVESNGSLLLQLPSGVTFPVAKQDCMLYQRAVRGDIVSFSFGLLRRTQFKSTSDLVSCIPSSPVVHCIRVDRVWDDVLHHYRHNHSRYFINPLVPLHPQANQQDTFAAGVPIENNRQQSWKNVSARRDYFDQFAAAKGMDPLNPVFWYNVTTAELTKYHHGYNTIIDYHGRKKSNTIMQLYPNIDFASTGFKDKDKWKCTSVRRAYFDQFAASKGMDPLNPYFWARVSTNDLRSFHNGIISIVKYYGGKVSTALMQLYPNIGLLNSHFHVRKHSWKSASASLAYFNRFAAYKGRDPRDPSFWYTVDANQLIVHNNAFICIAKYHGGKLPRTLMKLYPDIGLQAALFK